MDIDWEIIDDEIPQLGISENLPSKSALRNDDTELFQRFTLMPSTEIDQSPSSYFPAPQTDIKKSSSKDSFNDSRLLHDNGNDRHWKSVPAPTSSTRASTRIIPVHISDENQYSSATGTESLGTKITKVATNGSRHQRDENSYLMDSLNLANAGTSDSEAMVSSTREDIPKDERGFYNRRNELLSIVSNRLTPTSKRSSSVNSKNHSSSSNKSKHSPLSSAKNRSKNRPIKSASSTSSLASVQQGKKPSNPTKKSRVPSSYHLQKFDPSSIRRTTTTTTHQSQRTGPLRAHYSSDSEDYNKSRHHHHPPPPSQRRKGNTSISTRSEARQTNNNEPTAPILTPTSTPLPNNDIQTILDRSSSGNIINPWPMTTSYSKLIDMRNNTFVISLGSPSKDFGSRVSDQLNALRSLLENRLIEHEPPKSPKKEPSILQTSPGTFARQFLQSFRSRNSPQSISDDEDDKEVERTFPSNQTTDKFRSHATTSNPVHHYEPNKIPLPTFSPFSDELNQARMSSQSTPTSSSTIGSNLAAKIDTRMLNILHRILISIDHL